MWTLLYLLRSQTEKYLQQNPHDLLVVRLRFPKALNVESADLQGSCDVQDTQPDSKQQNCSPHLCEGSPPCNEKESLARSSLSSCETPVKKNKPCTPPTLTVSFTRRLTPAQQRSISSMTCRVFGEHAGKRG